MTPEEARKLLGGFATGTLTEAEEQALFAAALEDQSLFDELAREQTLRDLLHDPAAKGRLLAALDEPLRSWWWSWKPAAVLAMAGVAAVAVVVGTRKAPAPVQHVAVLRDSTIPAPTAPAPPAPAERDTREAAPRPEARRKFQAAPTPAPAAPVELEDAPKADALLKSEAPAALGAVAPTAVRPPAAPPVVPSAQDMAGNPMFERAAAARVRAFSEAKEAVLSARAMFLGASSAPMRVQAAAAQSAPIPQNPGLRYSIVRREGEPAPTLRITSNVNGYLSVGGATPVSLTAMRPYMTEPLTGDEVRVVFARQPETSIAQPVTPITEVSGGETYAVSPTGGALSFTISLKQQ